MKHIIILLSLVFSVYTGYTQTAINTTINSANSDKVIVNSSPVTLQNSAEQVKVIHLDASQNVINSYEVQKQADEPQTVTNLNATSQLKSQNVQPVQLPVLKEEEQKLPKN